MRDNLNYTSPLNIAVKFLPVCPGHELKKKEPTNKKRKDILSLSKRDCFLRIPVVIKYFRRLHSEYAKNQLCEERKGYLASYNL